MDAKPPNLRLFGRSSSHFTRVTRIFAAELEVPYEFQIVRDLASQNAADYAGNPALKVPILETPAGTWFGALNICRTLVRSAERQLRIVWPEEHHTPLSTNATELALHSMATGVNLIMAKALGDSPQSQKLTKVQLSLKGSLTWLDANLAGALQALPPDRDLSFLEVIVFSLVTHLEWREVHPTAPYRALTAFCEQFAERPSARATPYRFDT